MSSLSLFLSLVFRYFDYVNVEIIRRHSCSLLIVTIFPWWFRLMENAVDLCSVYTDISAIFMWNNCFLCNYRQRSSFVFRNDEQKRRHWNWQGFFPSNLSPIESIVIIVKHEDWFGFVNRFSLHSFPLPIHPADSNAQTKLTLIYFYSLFAQIEWSVTF